MKYTELRGRVLSILNNDLCEKKDADNFIELALRRCERKLRVPLMEKVYKITMNDSSDLTYVGIPKDYLKLIGLRVNGEPLTRTTSEIFRTQFGTDGLPRVFYREGPRYYIRPYLASGDVVEMAYYGEFIDIQNTKDVVDYSIAFPDLVIYVALMFAADEYIDARKQDWENTANSILTEIKEMAEDDEFAGGLSMGTPYAGGY